MLPRKGPLLALLGQMFCSQAFLRPFTQSIPAGRGLYWGPKFAALRAVETIDTSFQLTPEAQDSLSAYLQSPEMLNEVKKQAQCQRARFTGDLFQPVAYSQSTRLGMPPEFEQYHLSPSYAICNVPPIVMFKAKVFKPARLCAIYAIEELAPEREEEILARQRAKMDLAGQVAAAAQGSTADPSDWAGMGQAMRDVISEPQEGQSPDDDAELDARVV